MVCAAFSHAMGIDGKSHEFSVWQSSTIECESDGKKASIPRRKCGY